MRDFVRFFLVLVFCGSMSVSARPVPARIILSDGQEQFGTFIRLQADTVFYSAGEGDSLKPFATFKFDIKKVQLTESDSLVDLNLSDFEVLSAPPADTTQVVVIPTLKKGNATLAISSFPPNSRVYIDHILLDGITPMTVPELKPKKYTIMVRQYLKGVDWWGTAEVEAKAGATLAVDIKLLKPHTQLKIQSIPTEAEVYLDEPPSLSKMPQYRTDATIMDVRPGLERTIYFFKVGYHDTSVTIPVEAFMPNLVGVDLKPITEDLAKLEAQLAFVKHRQHKWLGRGLLWSSIAPLLAGATMIVLADRDWQKAVDYKNAYLDAAFESSETQHFVSENKRLNDSGDQKAQIAAGLGAGAFLLLTAGIILQF
jgi:hypothetical protein